ncbi:MAG: DUF4173 domain-containing protein [Pelagimonas sp.]|nr:DUF4173 domain-containing protein [Pelagimonas sp.]
MSKQLVIHGVPDSIRSDGWWLACSPNSGASDPEATRTERPRRHTALGKPIPLTALIVLVLLADWLFWDQPIGVSVAVFAMALSVGILSLRKGTPPRVWGIVLAIQLLCNLPVIEQLQALSVMFTVFGIAGLVAWVCFGRLVSGWRTLVVMLRVSTLGAVLLPVDLLDELRGARATPGLKQHLTSLILPLGVGMVFALLLTTANPILDKVVTQFSRLEFLTAEQLWRVLFWYCAASLIWPYLVLNTAWISPASKAPRFAPPRPSAMAWLITPASVRSSLVLFNILFAVQTVLDVGVLTGGMELPDGMTYARYAHRGAYPLVATALLAGLFAITIHKMIEDSDLLMNLLLLWLGQNLFLVIMAAFRLSLYVQAYSLTYLRVAAFIWMGLVFVGLVLTIVQVTRSLSIGWLVRVNLAALMGTLYLCCFVNFAWGIAHHNLNSAAQMSRLDTHYICRLGEQVLPLIRAEEDKTGKPFCPAYMRPTHTPNDSWRDWGFRAWRLRVYLDRKVQE